MSCGNCAMIRKMKNKKAQLWVETVLYTLIGIALIGVALAFLTPKIKEVRDKSVVEQTIASLNEIDEKIISVTDGPAGNRRRVDLTLKRGSFYVDSSKDKIYFVLDGIEKAYSEPDVEVTSGRVKIYTTEEQKNYMVTLSISYQDKFDIIYGEDANLELKKFTQAQVPYRLLIENKGALGGSNIQRVTISPAGND